MYSFVSDKGGVDIKPPFYEESSRGLFGVPNRDIRNKRLDQNRQITVASLQEARNIDINIRMDKRDKENYKENRIRLYDVLNGNNLKLSCEEGYMKMELAGVKETKVISAVMEFRISLQAPNPFWITGVEGEILGDTMSETLPVSEIGEPLAPFEMPTTFLNVTEFNGQETVPIINNTSDIPVGFRMRITGVAENIVIVGQGKFLFVDVEIAEGDELIIDTTTVPEIRKNGISVISKIGFKSDLFSLDVGENRLVVNQIVDTVITNPNVQVEVEYVRHKIII